MTKKKVVLLGATGSIGKSTLDVIRQNRQDFETVLLASCRDAEGLRAAAREFSPARLYLHEKSNPEELLEFLKTGDFDSCVFALTDFELSTRALEAVLSRTDRPVSALMASKETIVAFGSYFRALAGRNGHALIPLDSEPSAVFQCLGGTLDGGEKLSRIYLVATGGPFYRNPVPPEQVTPEMALRHPVWNMGVKITVDSSTLVNKALELMEISQIFSVSPEWIQILIHPQCAVHSMVEMANGSVLAQAGPSDMRLPIHYGLYWPHGFEKRAAVPVLDFLRIKEWNFDTPDLSRFPCLKLALEQVAAPGLKPREALAARLAFMAADEAGVSSFVQGSLPYARIPEVLGRVVEWAKETAEAPLEENLKTGIEFYRLALKRAQEEVERKGAEAVSAIKA